MSARSKYRVVGKEPTQFDEWINLMAADGYGVAHFHAQTTGEGKTTLWALMKLKDETVKLEDAEDVINVDITSQENSAIARRLKEGWIIVASFSKAVTMLKPKPSPPGDPSAAP